MQQSQAAVGSIGLRRSTESELWGRRDETRVREELVRRYLNLSRKLASRYQKGNESFEDLLQVASLGLLNAIDRFEPENGAPFVAFATPTINGELKRYFRDRIWLVRVPRGIQEEIMSMDHAVADLGAQLHRTPTQEEIIESTSLDREAVQRVVRAKQERVPVSLDSTIDDEGATRGESIGVIDRSFQSFEARDEVRNAMEMLSNEQRLVMRLRFIDEMTQLEIANRIGCSQMQVSRILRRSFAAISGQDA